MYVVQYLLDIDYEVTWMACSTESEIFYNSQNEFMIADPKVGLINIETKDVLFEYQTK